MTATKITTVDGSKLGKYDVLEAKALAILDAAPRAQKTFVEYALYYANQRRVTAGFNGAMNDGGASDLENVIEAWVAGLNGGVPDALNRVTKAYNRDMDPDYARYLELKEKYED